MKRKKSTLLDCIKLEDQRIAKLKGQAKSAATRRRNRFHAAIEAVCTPNPFLSELFTDTEAKKLENP